MPASREDWERVGRLLAERRVQISARYANRRAFAEETGLNWRTLYDAEYGKRATFRRETVRAFENAFRLAPGSIDRALAGGELEPLASLRPVPSPHPETEGSPSERERDKLIENYPDDEVLQVIGRQRRKKASMVVAEMLEWLDTQASHSGNGTAG
jgi:hypothetical protein